MYFQTIETAQDTNLAYIEQLYTSAFPLQERRDWTRLLEMIGNTPGMELRLILVEKEAIGLVILWKLSGWDFIEHFAIDATQRGKKYGEQVMQALLRDSAVILEVEPPETLDAQRRIRFYEKLGLFSLDISYQQPSYREPLKSYPLVLMSNSPEKESTKYVQVIAEIKRKVYGIKPAENSFDKQ